MTFEHPHSLDRLLLYRELLREREEILRHKWLESEKAGQDIGFDKALLGWVIKHRSAWRAGRREEFRPMVPVAERVSSSA
jgi:hypothetical protein